MTKPQRADCRNAAAGLGAIGLRRFMADDPNEG
jgi:hypothetical protein